MGYKLTVGKMRAKFDRNSFQNFYSEFYGISHTNAWSEKNCVTEFFGILIEIFIRNSMGFFIQIDGRKMRAIFDRNAYKNFHSEFYGIFHTWSKKNCVTDFFGILIEIFIRNSMGLGYGIQIDGRKNAC